MILEQSYIDSFINDGIVVVPNVLNFDEINAIRNELHLELLKYGINHDDILNGISKNVFGSRIKSPVSDIFYADFKLKLFAINTLYL